MNVDPFIPLGKPAVQDYELKLRSIGKLRSKIFAGHLLDLSSTDIEAIRNYLLELSKQAKAN